MQMESCSYLMNCAICSTRSCTRRSFSSLKFWFVRDTPALSKVIVILSGVLRAFVQSYGNRRSCDAKRCAMRSGAAHLTSSVRSW